MEGDREVSEFCSAFGLAGPARLFRASTCLPRIFRSEAEALVEDLGRWFWSCLGSSQEYIRSQLTSGYPVRSIWNWKSLFGHLDGGRSRNLTSNEAIIG